MNKYFIFFCLLVAPDLAAQPAIKGAAETSSSCGPIPAICYPITLNSSILGSGIHYVELNQISNSSTAGTGLEDFTCTDSTWLTPGQAYNFMVNTGMTYEETVRAWIDFNNDGNFDMSELIYSDSAIVYAHSGSVSFPANVLNSFIPLRMRVGSDITTSPTGCNNLDYGQYEDYTIYFGPGSGLAEQNGNKFSISPNPLHTSALLTVSEPIHGASFKIYNAMGAAVHTIEIFNGQTQINRDGLSSGLYYIIVDNGNAKMSSGKLVIE
jgi:hypothetical protein